MSNFPTLSVSPEYPLSPDGTIEDAVIRSSLEAGYQQTRPRYTRVRRQFGLNYTLDLSDVTLLRAFETTTLKNGADSFTWTHPLTGSSYVVRLSKPISYQNESYNKWLVSMEFQEV